MPLLQTEDLFLFPLYQWNCPKPVPSHWPCKMKTWLASVPREIHSDGNRQEIQGLCVIFLENYVKATEEKQR